MIETNISLGLDVWRLSRNQFQPVWAKTVENYPAQKLDLLSPQNRYIGHQGGIQTRPWDLVVPDPFGPFFGWFWSWLDHIGQIWVQLWPFGLLGPVYLDPFIWTCLFGPVYLVQSNWTCHFGPIYLAPSIWTHLFWPVYLDPCIGTSLFGPIHLESPIWTH